MENWYLKSTNEDKPSMEKTGNKLDAVPVQA